MNVIKKQYDYIKTSRELLLQFCESLNQEDYIKEQHGFGWGSIRNLHAHVAECYQFWLARFGMKEDLDILKPNDVNTVEQMRQAFQEVDQIVDRFLSEFEDRYEEEITGHVPWQEEEDTLTVLWLYTHTITHEFHHKGQLVSMARQLGYEPWDTDLVY